MNTTAAGYANTRLPFYVCTAESGGVGAFCLIAGPCRDRNASGVSVPHPESCEAVLPRFFVTLMFVKQ